MTILLTLSCMLRNPCYGPRIIRDLFTIDNNDNYSMLNCD